MGMMLCLVTVVSLVLSICTLAWAFRLTGEVKRSGGELQEAIRNKEILENELRRKDIECNRRIEDFRQACENRLLDKDRACAAALADKERGCEKRLADKDVELNKIFEEKEKAIAQAVENLRIEFSKLAIKSVNDGTHSLDEANRKNMADFTKQLVDQMQSLKEAAEKSRSANEGIGLTIKSKLEGITQTAITLGSKADGLVEALTNSNKAVGNWGEAVLNTVLDKSGLKRGEHYFVQEGRDDRPDVKVKDTQGRYILIDAKANLKSYIEYCNAKDSKARQEALKEHAKAVENQVKLLASKNYVSALRKECPEDSFVDLVAMFVPSEAAYSAALAEKPSLWQSAYEQHIIIVTPQTLLAYLAIVSIAWQQDTTTKNQARIIEIATRLLNNLNDALLKFETLESKIKETAEAYEDVKKKFVMEERAQNILRPARELMKIGIKPDLPKKGKLSPLLKNEDDDLDSIGGALETISI